MSKCIKCKERVAIYKKRQLCRKCYSKLLIGGRLPSFYKINSWSSRLLPVVNKYGYSIVHDLSLISDVSKNYTVSDLANKYECSRENARQIFFKVYGYSYTIIKSKKCLHRFHNHKTIY